MARQRTKQLEASRSLSKTGSVKSGFDSDLFGEDGWVLVKKQRVIIVLPSLPVSEPCTFHDPATSQSISNLRDVVVNNHEQPESQQPANFESQAELEDDVMDTHKTTTPFNIVEIQQESNTPATSESLAELKDVVLDTHETTSAAYIVEGKQEPQKPVSSQSQGELRDLVVDMVEAPQESQKPPTSQSQAELRNSVMEMVEAEQESQNPATSQSLPEVRDFIVDMVEAEKDFEKPATSQFEAEPQDFFVDMVEVEQESNKPATLQTQAEIRDFVVDMVEAEQGSDRPAASQFQSELQDYVLNSVEAEQESNKPATSQTQAELKDTIMCTEERQQESSPDLTLGHNLTSTSQTTRKASKKPNQESVNALLNSHRTGQRSSVHRQKPYRFPRVMCSSSLTEGNENEVLKQRLRMVNLEKKVEKAGGLNEWVGSIGLGREFERMLKGQRMSKYQVANLTMEKLKHMGAVAVGPRRKLIHAIHCVYHPHCLRPSSYLHM